MYIDSTEALGSFSQFIGGLGVKKTQDCRTYFPTTGTARRQRQIREKLDKLSDRTCQIDQDVVNEVRTSTISGVLLNSSNEMFHRLGCNSQRQSTAAKKSRESAKLGERAAELQAKINDEKTLLKGYQAELRSLKGTSSRSTSTKTQKNGNDSVIVSASSCGRVKTVTVPRWAKGIDVPEAPAVAATLPARAHDISETPVAAATIPAHAEMILPTDVLKPSAPLPPFVAPSATFDFPPLPSSTIPALDVGSFGLMQFDNQLDFGLDTYLGDPTYDFNFDPSLFGFDPTTTFASKIPGVLNFHPILTGLPSPCHKSFQLLLLRRLHHHLLMRSTWNPRQMVLLRQDARGRRWMRKILFIANGSVLCPLAQPTQQPSRG
ncbi:hypothetical protein B0H10DRAFT_2203029 [Mycena sp. CBHHK59/15]|nr:hypothetical protein B0H10DRAFT_2203029 [Mycena sp. CBHHK59/15]